MDAVSTTDRNKDEFAFEEWLRKNLDPNYRNSFTVSVCRNKSAPLERFTVGQVNMEAKFSNMVSEFMRGREPPEDDDFRELRFIIRSGLSREIAMNIDFIMRKKLEECFPTLKNFNVLCFKRKGYSTLRRAHVYQNEKGYKHFMDELQSLMTQNSGKYQENLHSKVKIAFRGKFVLQIDDTTYKSFMEEIQDKIKMSGVNFSVKQLIRRREISLFGNHEKQESMKKCVREIMAMLATTTTSLDKACYDHESYALKCEAGIEYFSRLNNKFNGKGMCKFDHAANELTLKGSEDNKRELKRKIESWVKSFNSRVKIDLYPIKNKQNYYKQATNIKKLARDRLDAMVTFDQTSKPPQLKIYYYEYKDEDRSLTPAHRKEALISFKKFLDQILGELSKDNKNRDAPEDQCQLCDKVIENKFRLICGHVFCDLCIRQNILETANQEGCKCPVAGCKKEKIMLMDLMTVLSPEDLKPLFLKQMDTFLNDNAKKYKVCPIPDCGNILCNPGSSETDIQETDSLTINRCIAFCDNCGQDYCFACMKTRIDEDCPHYKQEHTHFKPKLPLVERTQQQSKPEEEPKLERTSSFGKLLAIIDKDDSEPNQKTERRMIEISNSRILLQAQQPSMSVSHSRDLASLTVGKERPQICKGCRQKWVGRPQPNFSLKCPKCLTYYCSLCDRDFTKNAETKEIYKHAVEAHQLGGTEVRRVTPNLGEGDDEFFDH